MFIIWVCSGILNRRYLSYSVTIFVSGVEGGYKIWYMSGKGILYVVIGPLARFLLIKKLYEQRKTSRNEGCGVRMQRH